MTRTLNRYVTFYINNAADALVQLTSINQIGGLSLESPAVEMHAWADALKGVLLDTPSFSTSIGGVFDSADHAVLIAINNTQTARSFDVRVGMGAAYQAGVDPQFGITKSATSGVLIHNYTVNFDSMTWTAQLDMLAGSSAPAWGNANEAAA